MNNGMIRILVSLAFMLLPLYAVAEGEVYKIVDKDGNVTFTDQRPSSDAQPMVLPELSVIETDIPVTKAASAGTDAESAEPAPLTPRELRRKYRDFSITSPLQEETFWGTENSVVVSWGSSEPIDENMSVLLFVNGESRSVEGSGSVTLTLDRGEHQVFAELRDERNRRLVVTDKVTFFVKQASALNRRPGGP
jgi:hypothetical protein